MMKKKIKSGGRPTKIKTREDNSLGDDLIASLIEEAKNEDVSTETLTSLSYEHKHMQTRKQQTQIHNNKNKNRGIIASMCLIQTILVHNNINYSK